MSLPDLLAAAPLDAAEIELRIMKTTDLHMHALNYDYNQDREVDDAGLARTATLIREARAEATNSMLFDNGDLLQGNPMGDSIARARGLRQGEVHPMYKAMNLLGYDAAHIGNHEFNYGLEFLLKSLSGANFPYVLANVFEADGDDDASNDKHYFQPYVLLEREFVDTDGEAHSLVIGIAQSHPDGLMENATAELSRVPGIDAILFGHAHAVFPSESYAGLPGADLAKGTLNGVPSVMPGFWGSHLGVIDLTLANNAHGGGWSVDVVFDTADVAREAANGDAFGYVGDGADGFARYRVSFGQ